MAYKLIHWDGEVSLHHAGRDKFKVVYGKQVRDGLRYGAAAREYGECVFHQLACEGKLDNQEK